MENAACTVNSTEDFYRKPFMYHLKIPQIIASYYLAADYHDFMGVILIIRPASSISKNKKNICFSTQ